MTDSCCALSKKVKVNSGETAVFSCDYSRNHIYDAKVLFKERQNLIKEVIHSTGTRNKERFSISDDRCNNFFNVRISTVTPDDGGVYLCGVSISRYSSIIGTVYLHIMGE